MIIQSKWFCKLLGVKGIMLFPFIFVKNKYDATLVNHERIHLQQAKELWVIGFYWLYFKYYFHNRRIYKGIVTIKHFWSYRNIPFEREAFSNQNKLDYLKKRKRHSWKKYIAE